MTATAPESAEIMEKVNAYEQYQRREGIPRITGFAVEDLHTVEVKPWARRGARGTFINLDGTGGTNDAYVLEIPRGGATEPQRQLYEEMIYVLDGNGSTQVWYDDDKKVSFEWKAGSLFAIPVNAKHRHFNGRGDQPARYLAVTNAPVVINLFHNLDFIFNTPFTFDDRFSGQDNYFDGEGRFMRAYNGRATLETNFVPDTHNVELQALAARGAGGRNLTFELAHQTMVAHISEFPVGTYKKGHHHGPGAHVIILSGQGYSLLWPEGEDFRECVWQPGTIVVPPSGWFHQHFNSGTHPARYLALRWGSRRYDMGGAIRSEMGESHIDRKLGGAQIEYPDEDPRIHQIFEEKLAQSGAKCRMKTMVEWCTAAE